jgi:hypothetical protein
MQIDEIDEQHDNASLGMEESFEFSTRTDEGMEIDVSDEHPSNAEVSIRESFEPGSNATVKRDWQGEKQDLQSLSKPSFTVEGMRIDESDAHFSNAE